MEEQLGQKQSQEQWFNVICTIIAEIWKALSIHWEADCSWKIGFISYIMEVFVIIFIWVPMRVAVLLTCGMGHGVAKMSGLWKQMVCYDTADANNATKPKKWLSIGCSMR